MPARQSSLGGSATTRGDLHQTWTDWLSTFHWDHFATLTFAEPRSEASARRAFAQYTRSLSSAHPGLDLGYFCGYEYGTFGRLHLHALLRTSQDQWDFGLRTVPCPQTILPNEVLWHYWYERYGRAKVETYDRRRGAAGYVSKYVTKRLAYYDLDNMVPEARDLLTGTK